MKKKLQRFSQWKRLLEMMAVVLHFRLDTFLLPPYLCYPLRQLFKLHPRHRSNATLPLPSVPDSTAGETQPDARAVCLALEALGPIFVKLGQLLSTRHDLFSEPVLHALRRLQDNVTPFPGAFAQKKIETHLGGPIEDYLRHFDPTPLASASIAQVHTAIRHNGEEVVIKVTRPGILSMVQRDIAVMRWIARWIQWVWPDSYKLHMHAVIDEFERNLEKEMDLMYEASNAAQLKRHMQHAKLPMEIPVMHWEYATPDVLMMQKMQGISIDDLTALRQAGVCTQQLAQTLLDVFFTQALHFGFFHADMHPGNLFVKPDPKNNGAAFLVAVDFGIVGTLSPEDQHYLSENLLAFFKRDYRQVAALHIASGWVPANTRIDTFEAAIRQVCEPLFAQPIKKVSLGQLLARLLQTAHQFHMEVLPQLLLLQKTILQVESLSRRLDPDLDLWASTEHVVAKWLKNQMGWQGALKKIRDNLPFWLEKLPDIPELYYHSLKHASPPSPSSLGQPASLVHTTPTTRIPNHSIAMITVAQHRLQIHRTKIGATLRGGGWGMALLLGTYLYQLPSPTPLPQNASLSTSTFPFHTVLNMGRTYPILCFLLLAALLIGWIGHRYLLPACHHQHK